MFIDESYMGDGLLWLPCGLGYNTSWSAVSLPGRYVACEIEVKFTPLPFG